MKLNNDLPFDQITEFHIFTIIFEITPLLQED